MLNLYFWPTPNGKKVTIMLEEAGLAYRIVPVDIGGGDQFKPEFLAISPNNRMPALVDDEPLGGGDPISIFESGAILMYLAEKAGRFWPQDPRGKYEVAQWVMWQMANQGPKFGENGHFKRAAAEPANGDLSYARRRFDDEVNRLYGVMDHRLGDCRYLAGDAYTIADMISLPVGVRLEVPGAGPRRVPPRRPVARRARRAARRAARDGGRRGPGHAARPAEPRGAGAAGQDPEPPAGAAGARPDLSDRVSRPSPPRPGPPRRPGAGGRRRGGPGRRRPGPGPSGRRPAAGDRGRLGTPPAARCGSARAGTPPGGRRRRRPAAPPRPGC